MTDARTKRTPTVAAVAQLLVAAIVVVAVAALLRGLLDSQPARSLSAGPLLPATGDVVTCPRTLPDHTADAGPATDVVTPGRVTSSEVVACPRRFDGRQVRYTGEVVGDVLRRDGGAWVLVNDDAYALTVGPLPLGHQAWSGTNSGLTVWLPTALVGLVDRPGDHSARGTVLRVTGVLRRADPADGGGLTIRAEQAEVVAPAVELAHPLNRGLAVTALVLVVATTVVFAGGRLRARRA